MILLLFDADPRSQMMASVYVKTHYSSSFLMDATLMRRKVRGSRCQEGLHGNSILQPNLTILRDNVRKTDRKKPNVI